jgi:hypothetical protein
MNQNTVKTIRLAVAYKNEYGKILWNKEWRIFTVEVEGESDKERKDNAKRLLDVLHEELDELRKIVESDFSNEQARDTFVEYYEVQLFMADSDTNIVMDQGEWDAQKVVMRDIAERLFKDVLKDHPEMIDHIPPELRHRFK